jgi:uncharacterized protein YllA (UPF0747 family)
LNELFRHYEIPFPVLVLRNSFLIAEKKWQELIAKLGFNVEDFFSEEEDLMKELVNRESQKNIKLNGSLDAVEKLYDDFKKQAAEIDASLESHVESLRLKAVYRLQELEKKMLKAEKKKFMAQQRQIHSVREHLFPQKVLQERIDNLCSYYAKWGNSFIQQLYEHSLALEQEFVILREK